LARIYRKAAEQNYAKAQYNLGVCYAFGQGVVKRIDRVRVGDAEAATFPRSRVAGVATVAAFSEEKEAGASTTLQGRSGESPLVSFTDFTAV